VVALFQLNAVCDDGLWTGFAREAAEEGEFLGCWWWNGMLECDHLALAGPEYDWVDAFGITMLYFRYASVMLNESQEKAGSSFSNSGGKAYFKDNDHSRLSRAPHGVRGLSRDFI
jgi:hypothetical protein